MNENLLQFIWQFQYLNTRSICTVDGQPIKIIFPGNKNHNQGPDFLDAKIKIGGTTWAGNVELHVKSSDWTIHKHQNDKNYKNIILHVVWEHDCEQNIPFPTLALDTAVSKLLLKNYETLMGNQNFISCESQISSIRPLSFLAWKERLLIERLQSKADIFEKYNKENNYNWEESFWRLLAKSFGSIVNADAFEEIAKSISVPILARHKNQLHQLEALLFGQGGLLNENFDEHYPKMLAKEYQFLQKKYRLSSICISIKFLRMRPANFPTIRLAQLAMLIQKSSHLFSKIQNVENLSEIQSMLEVTANDYWKYHYRLNEKTSFKEKGLGTQMINNLIINCISPSIFAYGSFTKNKSLTDKAIHWLEQLPSEKNQITNGFAQLKINSKNAADSQSLIQLKKVYCNQKRCLQCAVGNSLLKKSVIAS